MQQPPKCIQCHVEMESGFVPDLSHSFYQRQLWAPGRFERRFWSETGLTVKRDQLIPVTVFRCPQCGRLEFYALPDDVSEDGH